MTMTMPISTPGTHGPLVLLVDDDEKIRTLTAQYLESRGFRVLTAADGAQGRQLLHQQVVEAIVLDVMMPKEDGFQVAQRWRLQGVETPILFLTARGEGADRVQGLALGAQDYLTKPFEPEELVLRLKNCLKKAAKGSALSEHITIGPYVFDFKTHTLHQDGQPIALTDLERQLLYVLARHPHQPLSRETLVAANLGTISDRTVDVQIARLRRKIGAAYIQTVRHKGYKLCP